MKHSNLLLIIGIAIGVALIATWSTKSTIPITTTNSYSKQQTTVKRAKAAATEVAFKPIWQVSKRLLKFE